MRLLCLAIAALSLTCPADAQAPPLVRFGVVTDLHYADIDPNGTRTYRDSDDKLAECVQVMNAKGVSFLVELGDFKDQDKTPDESRTLGYLQNIESVFAGFNGPRYHVIGNHDTDSLSKAEFLAAAPNTGIVPNATHYTFVNGGVRVIVLDASHKADGSDYDRGNFEWSDSEHRRAATRVAEDDAGRLARAGNRLRAPAAGRVGSLLREERRAGAGGAGAVRQGDRRHAGAPPRGGVQPHQRHPLLHLQAD